MFKALQKSRYYIPTLMTFFLGLLASRRWQQLITPQVWDEDGTRILYNYIMHGWVSFWEPVNGYMILVPKIISGLSLSISFLHYPLVSTIFAWMFIALVGVAITLSPTHLKGKFFCALAVFCIPTNPEVFGIPLYTFWWAAVLLFLLVFWDETVPALGWRMTFLVLGGLSSPVIVLVLPLLYARAWLYRSERIELLIAVVATIIAAIQLSHIVGGTAGSGRVLSDQIFNSIPIIFGYFARLYKLLGNERWFGGIAVLMLISIWAYQNRRDTTTWALLFLLFGSIALVAARLDISIIHPELAGPRYFFYPYILISWILVQFWNTQPHIVVRVILSFIAVMVLIAANRYGWSRGHDDLHWSEHVIKCRSAESYTLPIQYDGNAKDAWSIVVPGKRCNDLLNREF